MKTSHFKSILTYALAAWVAIAAGLVSVRAQGPIYAPIDLSTNPPAVTNAAADNNTPAADVANPVVTTNSVETNAPAPAADQAPADTNAAPAAAAAPATAAPASAEATDTNAAPTAPSSVVIPTIVTDDVPLTDAIKNLARQADINYILDPKVSFGPVGPDGKPTIPNISIRWENVTAEQALDALLTTYGLQLVEDAKTRIDRITVRDPAAPDPL